MSFRAKLVEEYVVDEDKLFVKESYSKVAKYYLICPKFL